MKRMVAGLQKAVGLNTVQRAKWPDTPAKFMASELALHDAVEGLTMLGVEPTLYPVALDAGLVPCVGGLLAHPNTDIVGDALALLAELTDPEGVVEEEEEEGQLALVSALTGSDALGTVVAALGTVAPPGHADQGESTHASSALRLMDNILELAPEAAEALGQGTNVLVWLLACLTLGGSSSNTLHAAELLGSLLAHTPNAKWAGELDLVGAAGAAAFPRLQPGEGAVQGLLAVVAPHCVKRKDATALPDAQMEEIVANAFTALRSCVRVPDNADRFRRAEGIILMLRAAASATGIAPHAMQLLDFAVEGNSTSAMNFVSEGGLRVVFAVFGGAGAKSVRKAAGNAATGSYQEAAISLLATLALHLPPDSTEHLRFTAKWLEGGCAKAGRLVDLVLAFERKVAAADKHLSSAAVDAHEETDAYGVELSEDEALYLRRLAAGLFTLQKLYCILAALVVGPGCNSTLAREVWRMLYTAGGSLSRAALELQDMAARAGEGGDAATIRALADALASYATGAGAAEQGAAAAAEGK